MPSSPYYEYEGASSPGSDYNGNDQYDVELMQFMQMTEDVFDLDQYVHEDSAWLPADMTAEEDNSHYIPPSPVIKIGQLTYWIFVFHMLAIIKHTDYLRSFK